MRAIILISPLFYGMVIMGGMRVIRLIRLMRPIQAGKNAKRHLS